MKVFFTAIVLFLTLDFTHPQSVTVVQNVQSYGYGCVVVNDIVYECDGTRRPMSEEDKANQAQWAFEFQQFMANQFPIGFPFVQNDQDPIPPTVRSPCRTCSETLI